MYNVNHKRFLQHLIQNSCISVEDALKFCNINSSGIKSFNDMEQFALEMNKSLSGQELKIVFLKCEVTGVINVVLLNMSKDNISKQQNNFLSTELEYFKHILKELVISNNHKIKIMNCFNLSGESSTVALRKDNIEVLIKKWIKGGYLVQDGSHICLGPRSIVEFTPYFQTNLQDYCTLCRLCSELVFTGTTCSSCSKKLHRHCIKRYLEERRICPNCKKNWQEIMEDTFNGDADDRED